MARLSPAGAGSTRADRTVPILLFIKSMALFGRDRDAKERTYDGVAGAQPGEVARQEVMMSDRERTTSLSAASGGTSGGMDAFLGKGTKVNGKLKFEGPARIEGQVDGEISAQDILTIGEGAIVNTKIEGTTIIIEGQVTGDVTAKQRLELRASARVNGDVAAPSLVIHDGAILNGQCSMTESKVRAVPEKSDAPTRDLSQVGDTGMRAAAGLQR